MDRFADVTALVISAEFLMGGILRVFPWPFKQTHKEVLDSSVKDIPLLYPVVPFKDVVQHNHWIGSWFFVTSILMAHPRTRGNVSTLGIALYSTGILAYSKFKTGAFYALPTLNAGLVSIIYGIKNGYLMYA